MVRNILTKQLINSFKQGLCSREFVRQNSFQALTTPVQQLAFTEQKNCLNTMVISAIKVHSSNWTRSTFYSAPNALVCVMGKLHFHLICIANRVLSILSSLSCDNILDTVCSYYQLPVYRSQLTQM
jgi:hypothetical protein